MILSITLILTNLFVFFIITIFYSIIKWIGKWFNIKVKYKRFGLISLSICLIWTLLALYGYCFGRFCYEIKEVKIEDERIPAAFEDYRIIQISDLHISGFIGHEAFVDTLVNAINRQKPDLICFTGDLVSITHKEVYPFIKSLQRLKARDGIISILGNHDYGVYNKQLDNNSDREKERENIIDIQRDSLDWNILLNGNYIIHHGNDSICIIGVENQACGVHQVVRRGDLTKALPKEKVSYSILLSHDPSHWKAEVTSHKEIALTLSGHTHAMQFRILGWTPSKWAYEECDGLYTNGEQKLYVNIGCGELLPFRIGATPEITQFTLKRIAKE